MNLATGLLQRRL